LVPKQPFSCSDIYSNTWLKLLGKNLVYKINSKGEHFYVRCHISWNFRVLRRVEGKLTILYIKFKKKSVKVCEGFDREVKEISKMSWRDIIGSNFFRLVVTTR